MKAETSLIDWSMSELVRSTNGIVGTIGTFAVGAAAAVGAATVAYFVSRPQPPVPILDINHQSSILANEKHSRVSALCKDGKLSAVLFEDVTTYYEAFLRGSRISKNGQCLGYRAKNKEPFSWNTYQQVIQRATNFGSGLVYGGQQPLNTTRIGIYSQNRPEYIITELGCYIYSMVVVPLYDTLGAESSTYIINQAELNLIVCDKNVKVTTLLKNAKSTPALKTIVCMQEVSTENLELAKSLGINIQLFSDVEKNGFKNPQTIQPSSPDDLCVICYTSGTTGNPKGVMITHKGLIATSSSLHSVLEPLKFSPDDVLISYLPLAHMYERICQTYLYMNGCQVGFFQGDIKLLMDDIAELRPTLFPSVPRLLNRIYDKTLATVNSSPIRKFLFNMAINAKTNEINRGIIRNDSIWDKLVFRKIQKTLGGRVRFIVSGSAPLSEKVLMFLRCTTGATVLEGYGQTESSGVSTLQIIGDGSTGHVGTPLTCNKFKLVDVAEMNYFADNNQGEVCTKGYNQFIGYFKQPDKTEETIDEDGWVHTGDIGEWLPNGTLKLIDRKKHIFKLAQGEYIAPEKIENVYVRSEAVAQVFVHGDSLQASLVAIVVPDPETLSKWVSKKLNIESKSLKELCSNESVKTAILSDLNGIGKDSGLHSFEQVKDIFLCPELFTVENGLLTPTFKSKRQQLKARFSEQIVEMYSRMV